MENNKYYTPNITDLRVGFECEVDVSSPTRHEHWQKAAISLEMLGSAALTAEGIRVPHLTREDIEKEGWDREYVNPYVWHGRKVYDSNTDYVLRYEDAQHHLCIWIERPSDSNKMTFVFNGTCRCINDFRLICKMLSI